MVGWALFSFTKTTFSPRSSLPRSQQPRALNHSVHLVKNMNKIETNIDILRSTKEDLRRARQTLPLLKHAPVDSAAVREAYFQPRTRDEILVRHSEHKPSYLRPTYHKHNASTKVETEASSSQPSLSDLFTAGNK